jgi:serine/threonine protein kinase
MKQIAPNTLIQSRYLVVQPIGKGGMGEVYLAVDQRLGSAVALKRTRFESDSPLGNAFEREARILARLRHPVLPKVIDHFAEGEGQFLVMEHISGDDLDKRLQTANKPFPLSWVMFWADQLLDALSYLHKHEPPIIHRDIKPQNLKLTDDNHIILLDFGLSKDFETGSKEAPAAGSVVGYSPHFASMEQVRGTGTDARSDLYSLSATLYQLLSNTVPPDALTRAEAILGGQNDPLQPLSALNPEVTKTISDVILQGMSVRQDHRWSSAGDMQKALRRAFNAPKDAAAEAATRMMEVPAKTEVLPAATEPSPSVESMPTVERIHESAPPADVTVRMDRPGMTTDASTVDETAVMPYPPVTAQPAVTPPDPPKVAAAAAAVSTPAPAQDTAAPYSPTRSSSKAPFIMGALLGLLLLGGIAGGGGWYYYTRSKAAALPTPDPSPAASVEPTPVPTINVVDVSTPEPANTEANVSTVPTPTSVKPTPQTVAKTGQTETKPPTAKATPKPKQKPGDDRTTILQ